jgi:hypothetical protein
MKIAINDERRIFAVQYEFNKMFPYLKLEFFGKSNKSGGAPSKKEIHHPSKTLGESRTLHNAGEVTITAYMTVGELEQTLRDVYDLSTEVFRKSGKAWLETSATEDWTLERQNKVGAEMEIPVSLDEPKDEIRMTGRR